MRRRLDIAASLVRTPELLFLDEPTTGLDPRSRNQVWEIIRAVAAEGTTVLLTTQYLEEADRLADRLAVIDRGRKALLPVFAFSLSWIWIVLGMLVKSPESVMTTSFLFLFPLTFASNILVGPATMPDWLQRGAESRDAPDRRLPRAHARRRRPHRRRMGAAGVAVVVAVFAPLSLAMYHRER